MDFSNLDEGHSDEEELHFYYDRKERIAHAPKIVQDYYAGKFDYKGGLFKNLVSTTGNKLLLMCVVVCAVAVVVLHKTGDKPYRKHIGSTLMTAAAFAYGDEVYASLTATDEAADKRTDGKEMPDVTDASNIVEARFVAVDVAGENVAEASAGDVMQGGKAELKTKFRDYDIAKVLVEVTYGGETKMLTAEIGGK